jgi:two-component system chemotaxis response regulator CheY
MKNKMVFVVDDDPVMRDSLKRYLVKAGFEVKAVTDGFEVLLLLEYMIPDLIISDINMPKLDGITLLEGLKNRIKTRNIPVIFMSGQSNDEIVERAKELGARFFLFKPFPLDYLDGLIKKVLPEEYLDGTIIPDKKPE